MPGAYIPGGQRWTNEPENSNREINIDKKLSIHSTTEKIPSWAQRASLIFVALLGFSLYQCTKTGPLTPKERELVIQEITLMSQTNEQDVTKFLVREATPSRIERLYLSPDVLKLSTNLREYGLILAGKESKLLSFEKPSDVLQKISTWFPEELGKARAQGALWPDSINLKGPYSNWDPEPAAFVALWKCMPRIAWLMPDRLPFPRPFLDKNSLIYPLAAQNVFAAPADPSYKGEQGYSDAPMTADVGEYEFGFCVWQRLSNLPHTGPQSANGHTVSNVDNEAVTPLLRKKFAHYLKKNRCKGRGPDDCVLILRLWASLDAGDPALASLLKLIEPDIWPGLPQPGVFTTKTGIHDFPYLQEKNIDPFIRKASFLRTKVLSLLIAPDQWPPSALTSTLRQMTELEDAHWALYSRNAMHYDNWAEMGPIDPWSALGVARDTTDLDKALLGELTRLGRQNKCAEFDRWIRHIGSAYKTIYAQREIASNHMPHCALPDWHAVLNDDSPSSGQTPDTEKYLAMIDHVTGDVLNMLLFGLTDYGQKCFGNSTNMVTWQRNVCERWIGELGHVSPSLRDLWLSEPTEYGQKCFNSSAQETPWLRDVCEQWISEPQTVNYSLKHSRLKLTRKKMFAAGKVEDNSWQNNLEAWLVNQVQNKNPSLASRIRQIAQKLSQYRVEVRDVSMWTHPKSAKSLIVLEKASSDVPWPYGSSRIILVVEPDSVTVAGVPPRFGYQYDEGQLAQVSDLDADGDLEVWFVGSWGECDGEDSKPGVDCGIEKVDMGEIHGDVVSYFSRSLPIQIKRPHKNHATTSIPSDVHSQ